jgi:hypothetical protein
MGRQIDLNYLFFRQQVERTRAEQAGSEAARKAHEGLAAEYEDAIERLTGGNIRFGPGGKSAGPLQGTICARDAAPASAMLR